MAVRVDRAESTQIRVSSHIVRLALEELYSGVLLSALLRELGLTR